MRLEVADTDADELVVTPDMRSAQGRDGSPVPTASSSCPAAWAPSRRLLEIWVSSALGMHGKPVVVLDPDGVFDPLREQVERLVDLGFVRRSAADVVGWVRDVPDAFELIERPEQMSRATI